MTLCLAGFRTSRHDGARLVATFEASSDAEAMSKFYAMYDMGPYKPCDSSGMDPYAEDLKARQQKIIED